MERTGAAWFDENGNGARFAEAPPPFAFGFTHDDRVTPVFARRAFRECQSFHSPNSWVGGLAGDGTLWAEGLDEEGHDALVHLVAGQKPQSYAPFSRILDLAIGAEGEVWTATDGRVARLDATGWRAYTTTHGLPDQADEVAVGADGTMWARAQGDVRRLDPAGDRWLSCPDEALHPQGGLPEFIQAAGDPLYLVSLRGAAELAAPESAGRAVSAWRDAWVIPYAGQVDGWQNLLQFSAGPAAGKVRAPASRAA